MYFIILRISQVFILYCAKYAGPARIYHHNVQLILPSVSMYQHMTTFQLAHKNIEEKELYFCRVKEN